MLQTAPTISAWPPMVKKPPTARLIGKKITHRRYNSWIQLPLQNAKTMQMTVPRIFVGTLRTQIKQPVNSSMKCRNAIKTYRTVMQPFVQRRITNFYQNAKNLTFILNVMRMLMLALTVSARLHLDKLLSIAKLHGKKITHHRNNSWNQMLSKHAKLILLTAQKLFVRTQHNMISPHVNRSTLKLNVKLRRLNAPTISARLHLDQKSTNAGLHGRQLIHQRINSWTQLMFKHVKRVDLPVTLIFV